MLRASACCAAVRGVHTGRVSITPRATNASLWYADVLSASALVDASTPVRGCAILRPRAVALWDEIRLALDVRIKNRLRARGVALPLLVPASLLAKEAAHVAGFAPEAAVVTHTRLTRRAADGALVPDATAALADPLVVRPTSEPLVWDAFSRWVRSRADLPLIVNQWANVLRWERRTRPFLRTSEFFWQEGHSAHATEDGARALAVRAMREYESFFTESLALAPVVGEKSPSERFAGAVRTRTAEIVFNDGWALQTATAHELGTAFSHAFGVSTERGERVWGTSWGASTRMIGAIILAHSDDRGLVLPPRVAPEQVVVVACSAGAAVRTASLAAARMLRGDDAIHGGDEEGAFSGEGFEGSDGGGGVETGVALAGPSGIRVALDLDTGASAGARFFAWERCGVPIRVEVGAKEAEAGTVSIVDRIGVLEKSSREPSASLPAPNARGRVVVPLSAAREAVTAALELVHAELLRRTSATRDALLSSPPPPPFDVLVAQSTKGLLDEGADEDAPVRAATRAYVVPWTDNAESEARVKAATKLTLRCFPDALQPLAAGKMCWLTGHPATHMALFSRAS